MSLDYFVFLYPHHVVDEMYFQFPLYVGSLYHGHFWRLLPYGKYIPLILCATYFTRIILTTPTGAHRIRYSRGTPRRTSPTKTMTTAARTTAPCQRSSQTTARRAMAKPRRTWERQGWTSRTAKRVSWDIMAAQATALLDRWEDTQLL